MYSLYSMYEFRLVRLSFCGVRSASPRISRDRWAHSENLSSAGAPICSPASTREMKGRLPGSCDTDVSASLYSSLPKRVLEIALYLVLGKSPSILYGVEELNAIHLDL